MTEHVAGGEVEGRLEALTRPDKWYLSAGEGIVWAPPFPAHLHRPGFWDELHVLHFPVAPLFTVALVDPQGRDVGLEGIGRLWRPDRLVARWRVVSGSWSGRRAGASGGALPGRAAADAETPAGTGPGAPGAAILVEERAILPGARLAAWWRREDGWDGLEHHWLVAFGQVPEATGRSVALADGIGWARDLEHGGVRTTMTFHLTCEGATGRRAIRSQGRSTPEWRLTPFPASWGDDGPGDDPDPAGPPGRGWVHVALARPLAGLGADERVGFVLGIGTDGLVGAVEVGGGEAVGRVPSPGDATAAWRRALSAYPTFRCSDERLTRWFDHRLYGLHLNRIVPGPRGYSHPAVAEGIEYFHWPIGYSAPCHMMETRWSRDPSVARGSILGFLTAQRPDGSLPGRLRMREAQRDPEPDFYHANWGDGVLAVEALHPDPEFRRVAYDGLARYAGWLRRERDPEGSGMVTVVSHYETGQEYGSRYLAVDPDADAGEWEPRLALKGVDATVYRHRLERALAVLAHSLDEDAEAARWEEAARRSGDALRDRTWDDEGGFFTDVDPSTGRPTGVRASVGFHMLLTDQLDDERLDRLMSHLEDPGSFGTTWPVPSSPVDDPRFDPRGLWKGVRLNCPWNGRVWPMTNSHVVEGLLRQWRAGRRRVGPLAAHLLKRFVHMMFDDGDPRRPNTFEHYDPYTAQPSRFRGIDDYQHSWVVDLLIRGAAGLDPAPGGAAGGASGGRDAAATALPFLVVDPLPLGLEWLNLEGCPVRGHEVSVRLRGEAVEVEVDGEVRSGRVGEPLEVRLR